MTFTPPPKRIDWSALATFLAHPWRVAGVVLVFILIALGILWYAFLSAPHAFPTNHLVTVEKDVPLSVVAEHLASERVIRSPLAFMIWARLTGAEGSVHSGRYLFARPLTVFGVVERLESGETGVASIRVTLTEGMTAREMADLLSTTLPDFSRELFLEEAKPYEGYLFPDTYFFEPGVLPTDVVARLRATFEARTEEAQIPIGARTPRDIVIMASLLEKEAQGEEDMRIVSGILWNRIARGMPLQVDAVFGYIKNRSGYAPTIDDLAIDSPYNTYTNKGLPPGPIANPGLTALRAAANPATTPFLYYLTDNDGVMRYAGTFEAHKANRELYGV